jgi:hypothetical protein
MIQQPPAINPGPLFGTRTLEWTDDNGDTHPVHVDFYDPQSVQPEGFPRPLYFACFRFRGLGDEQIHRTADEDKITAISAAFQLAGRILSESDHPVIEELDFAEVENFGFAMLPAPPEGGDGGGGCCGGGQPVDPPRQ